MQGETETRKRKLQPDPPSQIPATRPGKRARLGTEALKKFARQGGPDLQDLRGVRHRLPCI